jgi:misacylated tRNA(Ala) deacylase
MPTLKSLIRMGADLTPAIVGSLKCQQNSFLKTYTTTVVSCEEHKSTDALSKDNDKKSKGKKASGGQPKIKYAVELANTILFPEGGGQPSDKGYIVDSSGSKHFVDFIKRDKLRAIHLVDEPLNPGDEVKLEVDWKRRLDHMQQHTGQHLLSAILDKYEIPTLSWSMGDLINYIEIPRALSDEEVENISEEINDRISEAIDISVEIPEKNLVKQDKLPDDYDVEKGVLRVIKIGELDQNPCCGTHLQSTAQILSIALLHQTSVRGTNSRLHFLAGDRVRQYAVNAQRILKQTSSDLSCQMDEINDKINNLNLNYRKSNKSLNSWKDEVANILASQIVEKFISGKEVVFLHRSDPALDFLSLVLKIVLKQVPEGKTLVLLAGEGKEGGSVIVYSSSSEKSLEIGKHLQSLVSGLKGGGKGKWQGKISAFEKGELESVLSYLESL